MFGRKIKRIFCDIFWTSATTFDNTDKGCLEILVLKGRSFRVRKPRLFESPTHCFWSPSENQRRKIDLRQITEPRLYRSQPGKSRSPQEFHDPQQDVVKKHTDTKFRDFKTRYCLLLKFIKSREFVDLSSMKPPNAISCSLFFVFRLRHNLKGVEY